ncbi:MAG: hypothetical protein ABIH83_00205 [Candidatus Micrarchaeota archaeon]
MKIVYECDTSKKGELKKMLEDDPYGEKDEKFAKMSFSKLGYKLKEGSTISEDEKKLFLILRGSDDYGEFVKEKLKDLAKRCEKEIEEKVMKKIEEEETGAEMGMGAVFVAR